MTTEHDGLLASLAARWATALDRSEPVLDEARSQERWIAAFQARSARTGARRRGHFRGLWLSAAAVVLLVGGTAVVTGTHGLWHHGPQAGAWLETTTDSAQPLVFGDGSRVEVQGGSRVLVASVDPEGARITVERGAIHADIVHRTDTDWAFESGPFVVQVTGTALTVSWQPSTQEFSVEVQSGSVWVTGPMLDGGRSVVRGQRCRVRIPDARLEVTRLGTESGSPSEVPSLSVTDLPLESNAASEDSGSTSRHRIAAAPPPSFVELERAGKYREALAVAERVGFSAILGGGTTTELMSLERAARLGGRPDLSRSALGACRARFPGTPEAATAAYLLGRSAAAGEAAQWFETYLTEHPSGALAREAEGRVIESHHAAGNHAMARATAERYLARYPDGPHAAFAKSVLGVDELKE
ncbi:MAG: FecR domain-containing protein [Polyangiaceae bacterium]|nr:FecR domain-containing protein [Polyangiaceae bacterium]